MIGPDGNDLDGGMTVDRDEIREDPALRRGLYGLREMTRYLGFDQARRVHEATVARWTQQALSDVEHRPRRPDYSFADLVSLLVVRNLVFLGISLRDIRAAEGYLRDLYGIPHPFNSIRLKTDGVDVFFDASPSIAAQLTSANRAGQEVFEPVIFGALTRVGYDDQAAIEWSPIEGVVLDPTIQFGEPCIVGTRMTTSQVAEVGASLPVKDVAHMYRLDPLLVERALEFERKLAQAA